jgi:mitogen-activated protein kinase 15
MVSTYKNLSTKKTKSGDISDKIQDHYEIIERICKGSFGIIYKAIDKYTNTPVAVKKIYDALTNKNDAERLYREIKLFEHFQNHPNIIKLLNVIKSDLDGIYLIFEYMEINLYDAIRSGTLALVHVQYITYQLLKAFKYIHSADIVNRDLKPSHILLNSDCTIRLIDFGLAKSTSSSDEYNLSITDFLTCRWYRAPEVIIGGLNSGKEADMWTIGCIVAEMLTGRVFFPGTCTLNQLSLIVQFTNSPSEEDLNEFGGAAKSLLGNVKRLEKRAVEDYFKNSSCNIDAIDFVEKLLRFNPKKRITVEEALDHPFVKDFKNPIGEITCESVVSFDINEETINEVVEYKKMWKIMNEERLKTRVNTMR